MRKIITGLFTLVLLSCGIHRISSAQVSFSPEKTGFTVEVRGNKSNYRIMSIMVLPQDTLVFRMADAPDRKPYDIRADAGTVSQITPIKWVWRAPDNHGLYSIVIRTDPPTDSMVYRVFVAIPLDKQEGEYLNGYRIGKYPGILYRNLGIYKPPSGFIEVTKSNENILVSPHFRLKQFLCKQTGGYPKYIVLRQKLLLKLESLLEKVNVAGYPCQTFNILSGYRTPYYNKLIGNVKYSRHLWGGAADIFIDEEPKDDMMDDLNRDGSIDWRDAAVLYDLIDGLYGTKEYEPYKGGLGRYKKTPAHGPFVHIDVRGFRARWGD